MREKIHDSSKMSNFTSNLKHLTSIHKYLMLHNKYGQILEFKGIRLEPVDLAAKLQIAVVAAVLVGFEAVVVVVVAAVAVVLAPAQADSVVLLVAAAGQIVAVVE